MEVAQILRWRIFNFFKKINFDFALLPLLACGWFYTDSFSPSVEELGEGGALDKHTGGGKLGERERERKRGLRPN